MGFGAGFKEYKAFILVTILSLVLVSFGWFESFFSFRIYNFMSLRVIVGLLGLVVFFQFYKNRT